LPSLSVKPLRIEQLDLANNRIEQEDRRAFENIKDLRSLIMYGQK
jgi:hypothetical protein